MPADHSISPRVLVYFVQHGESGPIKIGRTTGDPVHRLKGMQVGAPDPLRLLAITPAHPGYHEVEIHRRFLHLRYRGEWFRPESELLDFIAGMPVVFDPPLVYGAGRAVAAASARKQGPPMKAGPGRPAVTEIPSERRKHIDVAIDFLTPRPHRNGQPRHYPAWRVAAMHGVSRRTVYLWTRRALSYVGIHPEADVLTSFADHPLASP